MIRKTSVALAALLVATTAAISPAAHAATKISNGVTCTKKNATTKVGTDKYTCTTNPIATGAAAKKLVWIWSGCLSAAKQYTDTKTQYDALLKSAASTDQDIQANINANINALILWKSNRTYLKGEVVYEANNTFYVAIQDSNNKTPSLNLNTYWQVNVPTAANPSIGTSPDAATAIAWKQRDIDDWSASVTKLTDNLKKLQAYENPDLKTKTLMTQTQTLITNLKSGISSAQSKISKLQNSIKLLESQKSNQLTIEALKSNVTQAASLRSQSCAKGV